MSSTDYDVIVLGGGAPGEHCAAARAARGLRVADVGEYEGDVVAANIAGDPRPANYEAVPRVTYTDPEAAAVGAAEAPYSATTLVSEVPKTAPTHTLTPTPTGS